MKSPPWFERMPWAIPAAVVQERRALCEVCDPGIKIKSFPWPYEACDECGCALNNRLRTTCPQKKW